MSGRQAVSALDHRAVAAAFGAILRTARVGAALSQEELAEAAGIDYTYPSLLERGLRQPSLAMVIALAGALKMEAALLVTMTVRRLKNEVQP
jgi:transcriptional regulator with XRE-family HTH domain